MPRVQRAPARRRRRAKGDAARSHAKKISTVLFEAWPAGVQFAQLMQACELSRHQLKDGLAMLRDEITDKGWPPLIHTRAEGYQFTGDLVALQSYEVTRIHEHLVEVRRLITATVGPHLNLAPTDKYVRHMNSQLEGVAATLDLLAAA
ncbi:RacP protein [Streptomyces violascens]|uniref:RacP protein n=1 Tax=Streptomyces violascens TaxID=67381 RepID=UPI0036960EA2